MNTINIWAALLLCLLGTFCGYANSYSEVGLIKQFEDFIEKYSKTYSSAEEKLGRFKIFKANIKKIQFFNQLEQGTATYGPTKFTDLTEEEFTAFNGVNPYLQEYPTQQLENSFTIEDKLPTTFDWRDEKVVTLIKNQGQCGSCWAFSAVANIEGQWALKKKALEVLSEQELVDCDKIDHACAGGLQSNAYKEIMRLGGLMSESDYPYTGLNDTCVFDKNKVKVYINGSLELPHNETIMQSWLVKNGPIAIAINANAMQFYEGGVSHPLSFLCPANNLDHGVLLVGYGVHNYPLFNTTLPYWIVKNSWGATWGEQGYYRVFRGDGTCGLDQMPTSSIIN